MPAKAIVETIAEEQVTTIADETIIVGTDYKSIRQMICEAVRAQIKTITKVNQYNIDIGQVDLYRQINVKMAEYPSCIIWQDSESKTITPMNYYECHLVLGLETTVKDQEASSISETADKALTDIEIALMEDPTFSGLAVDSTVISNDFIYGDATQPYATIITKIDIYYRHKYNDPSIQLIPE